MKRNNPDAGAYVYETKDGYPIITIDADSLEEADWEFERLVGYTPTDECTRVWHPKEFIIVRPTMMREGSGTEGVVVLIMVLAFCILQFLTR